MSYIQLGKVTASGDARVGSDEADRRAVLDPIVAEYRDRIAVNLAGRLEAAESVLGERAATNHAVLAATSPTTFWNDAPADLASAIQAVALAKSDAEQAKAEFTKAYKAIVPRDPYQLNTSIPSEWAIKNTLDTLDGTISKATETLGYWEWGSRNSKTFGETYDQYLPKIPKQDDLTKFLIAAAVVYIGGQLIGRK